MCVCVCCYEQSGQREGNFPGSEMGGVKIDDGTKLSPVIKVGAQLTSWGRFCTLRFLTYSNLSLFSS